MMQQEEIKIKSELCSLEMTTTDIKINGKYLTDTFLNCLKYFLPNPYDRTMASIEINIKLFKDQPLEITLPPTMEQLKAESETIEELETF